MANRFPLVLDTDAGNKIKELPSGDNLNLRESSIVNVQDVTALGTINAAIITVNGERLVAQNFLNLTDVPNTYVGSENYFVKVNETGTGLEFRPIEDIGNLVIDTITISERLEPSADNVIEVGTETNKIAEVWAYGLRGSLVGYDGTLVFDAETNQISYAALQGAPQFLSEFQNDVGYLRTIDLDAQWQALFDGGRNIPGDLVGSVFSNDSVLMVDALESKIRGDIEFTTSTGFIEGETIAILPTAFVDLGQTRLLADIRPENAQGGSVGTETYPFGNANFINATVSNISSQQMNLNDEVGIGTLYGSTDLILDAANRVKIGQGVPFKVGILDQELAHTVGQPGDIIYNAQINKFQLYQDTEGTMDWVTLNEGVFKGEVYGSFYANDGVTQVIRGSDGYITNPIITGNATFLSNVQVDGNLTILGTTTTIDTQNTTITDNVIVLNQGELGPGVTLGTSGIEVDRGSEANVSFVYREADDRWTTNGTPLAVENVVGISGLSLSTSGDLDGEAITISPGGNLNFITLTADYIRLQGSIEENIVASAGITGDLTGSVFADDSTILVDSVNSTIPGVLTGPWSKVGSTFNVFGNGLIVSAPASSMSFTDLGLSTAFNDGTNISSYSMSSTAFSSALTDGTNNAAYTLSDTAISATMSNGSNSLALTVSAGGVSLSTTGQVIAAITGDVGIVSDGNFTVTADNIVIGASGITVGNIDNTTLNIGTTNATAINIGRAGSTTTIDGIIQFTDALIANNLTADDSIIIQTEGNSANEAITIFPKGTNTRINLRADGVNFIGPVVSSIEAIGGVTGDLTGSVFAQDSTLLVDGLDGILRGNIDNGSSGTIDTGTLTVGTEIKTSRLTNLSPGITDLDISFAGTVEIEAGTNAGAGTSNITLDKLGTSYITITTEPINPATSDALVSINTTAAAGDVQIGSVASARSQVVSIYNAEINGTLTGNVDGTLTGSMVGSVFAEDSGVMVDAANYAMFADTMTLTPLNSEPASLIAGMLVAADGTSWDPASKAGAVPYPVFYDGVAWNALY